MSHIVKLSNADIRQQDNTVVLADINLNIGEGEFTYLIGKTGSGKTSLLKTLYGALPLIKGFGEVAGFDLRAVDRNNIHLLRRKLGIVFQDFNLLTDRNVEENMNFVLLATGWTDAAEMNKRVTEVLEGTGLLAKRYSMPFELSGGEQQRVAIARALASEPSLILADEPTGELDSATATAVFSLLRELARAEGITIVTCTHDRLVMEMASRVEELADGHLVTGKHREVWDRIQQRERSPFAATPAAGIEEQPALSSLIGADLSQFKPASERVVHVAAEPHHEEGVQDASPARLLQEKRVAASQAQEPPAAPAETAPEEPPETDAAARWGRPQD